MEAKFELTANDAQLKAAFDAAIQKIDRLESRTQKADDTFKQFGSRVAAAFSVGAIANFTKSIVDEFSRIQDLADRFDTTAEEIQRLGRVAEMSGSNAEQLARALTKVESSLNDTGAAGDTFRQTLSGMGIDEQAFKAASMTERVIMLADAYNNAEDGGKAFSDVLELVGIRNADLVVLFKEGGDEIKRMMASMSVASNETVSKLEQAGDKMAELSNEFKAAWAGPIASITDSVDRFIEKLKAAAAYWGALSAGASQEEAGQAFMGPEFRDLNPSGKRDDFKPTESTWAKEEKQWKDLQEKMIEGAEELKTKKSKLNDELHDGQVQQFREYYKEQSKKYEDIAAQQIKDVEEANEIKISAAESAYEIAKKEAEEAKNGLRYIQDMASQMSLFANYAGRSDLQATVRGAQEISKALGISEKEARGIQDMMDNLAAWDRKQAADPRNKRAAAREEERKADAGRAQAAEQKRREKAAEDEDAAARKTRGSQAAQKAADEFAAQQAKAAEKAQQKEMDERRAKEDAEAARKKAEEDLEAVKKNTKDTADKLKELSKA